MNVNKFTVEPFILYSNDHNNKKKNPHRTKPPRHYIEIVVNNIAILL